MTPEELRTLDRAVAVKLGWVWDGNPIYDRSYGLRLGLKGDLSHDYGLFNPTENWVQTGPLLEMMRATVWYNQRWHVIIPDGEPLEVDEADNLNRFLPAGHDDDLRVAICKAFVSQP